jgi:hypothetical protein
MNIVTLIGAAQIFEQFGQMQISPRLAYKIMKFCKSVSVEEEFYNEKRNEIINKYALRNENGQIVVSDEGMIHIIKHKIDEANNAFKELNNIEVEMPNVKFTLAELEELKLSVADMFVLDAFIEE